MTGQVALEAAFQWCCHRRKDSPPDADIWHLWFHWPAVRQALFTALRDNRYRLSPLQITGRGRDAKAVWSAQDAVVLKWVAMQLQTVLPVHPLCEHHKGHGGGKRSVQRMHDSLQREGWQYVCRTDIQGFYAHIRRGPLMRQLKRHVQDPVLLNLVRQYLHYSVERGGEFHTPKKGICRGCALSPLLAGFCLWAMDTYFEAQPHLRYVRFMDDIVILTRTRWHLRQAVRALNVFFASGGYRQHPDKTFIGRTERGFDWMGIQFNGSGIEGVAPRALANHRERCRRLYEQVWRHGKMKTLARVSAYVKRWTIWRNSMTDSANNSSGRMGWWSPLMLVCRRAGIAALFLFWLTPAGAASAVPSCGDVLGQLPFKVGPALPTPTVNTEMVGVNPPYPYIGSTVMPSQTVTCSMGSGSRVSWTTGPNHLAPSNKTTYRLMGGLWVNDATSTPATWASNCSSKKSNPQDTYSYGFCYRYAINAVSPLICNGADGLMTAMPNNAITSAKGGASGSVACRDRPSDQRVEITLPAIQVVAYGADSGGRTYSPVAFTKPPTNTGLPHTIYFNGTSKSMGPVIGNVVLGENLNPNVYCYDDVPTDCLAILGMELHVTYNVPGTDVGICTASIRDASMEWNERPASGVPVSPGMPIPGVPSMSNQLQITCSGGSTQADTILLTTHGSSIWRPDVIDSTNDSIGFRVRGGTSKSNLITGQSTTFSKGQGVIWDSSGPSHGSLPLVVEPIAKMDHLLVGRATANVTIDVYAADSHGRG